MLAAQGFLEIGDARLEYRLEGPECDIAPTIVLLHEGLGCAALWGEFPRSLSAATGAGVFAWSRAGYGASSPVALPRPLTYMHGEALNVVGPLLDAIGFRSGILLGHSDGASIAAIYAGGVDDARVRGVSLMAPHFFTEEMGLAEIAKAKIAYEQGDLRARLSRWHAHVDCAFHGWNGAWLDPGFRDWDLSDYLQTIRCPVQIIQGAEDQYGSLAQVHRAETLCPAPVESLILPGIRHSPYREAPAATLAAAAAFYRRTCQSEV